LLRPRRSGTDGGNVRLPTPSVTIPEALLATGVMAAPAARRVLALVLGALAVGGSMA
jgi:hypothetical protein